MSELDSLHIEATLHKESVKVLELAVSNYKLKQVKLVEALHTLLVQFGTYQDGDGAAKFHAITIAEAALSITQYDEEGLCNSCGAERGFPHTKIACPPFQALRGQGA